MTTGLSDLITQAEAVTAINLMAPAERVARQLVRRTIGAAGSPAPRFDALLRYQRLAAFDTILRGAHSIYDRTIAYRRRPGTSVVRQLPPQRRGMNRLNWTCLNLYSRQRWLETHYAEWSAFVSANPLRERPASILELEPDRQAYSADFEWRVRAMPQFAPRADLALGVSG